MVVAVNAFMRFADDATTTYKVHLYYITIRSMFYY